MALSNKHHHHRSSSDPFSDPTTISYSSYGVPTLSRIAPQSHRPPPLPPKAPLKPSSNRYPQPVMANRDIVTEAVRDTVTVRHVDQSPRTRMGRSQTQVPPASSSRPAPVPTRRSISQDSVVRAANTVEKAKHNGSGRRTANKKGSSHADIIDRMDFSGVGTMFHHDGPFDACAPSRNRHRTKAPMLAWSGAPTEDKDAFAAAREIPSNSYDSPYPAPSVYAPYEPPKKKRDAIAEAWGTHEPEPFEDFSAGGGYSTAANGEYGNSTPSSRSGTARRTKDNRDREKYREYLDEAQPPPMRRQQTKRSALPPPQPIFVPEADAAVNVPPSPTSPQPASPGAPKRAKSIMHRIRKMRDSPNIPVAYDEAVSSGNEHDPSPSSSAEDAPAAHYAAYGRPTHRSQNSFLGRIGRGNGNNNTSPTSDHSETFVNVEEAVPRKDKSLPATPAPRGGTPPGEYMAGYFDSTGGGYAGTPGGGLGRKTSLLKKMRGVVKGGAK